MGRSKALPPNVLKHRDVPLIYVARMWVRPRPGAEYEIGWKVGTSTNLVLRARNLAGWRGFFDLRAIGLGSYPQESEIHRRLQDFRAVRSLLSEEREWFVACEEFDMWLRDYPAVWRGSVVCEGGFRPHERKGNYDHWTIPLQRVVAKVVNDVRRPRGAEMMPRTHAEAENYMRQGWLFNE